MPGGKFCTAQMKGKIIEKYCNDTYGKGNYENWIGYRFEEGNRIWGKNASQLLGSIGLTNTEKTELYLDCIKNGFENAIEPYFPCLFESESDKKQKEIIMAAIEKNKAKGFRFMPELTTENKKDVIAWWSDKDFDLKIGEHRTNCLFCIEKPKAVIMLAIKDCPEAAKEFLKWSESENIPEKINKNGEVRPKLTMYRGGLTFRDLYEKAIKTDRSDLLQMSRIGLKMAKSRPCTAGECNPFGDNED